MVAMVDTGCMAAGRTGIDPRGVRRLAEAVSDLDAVEGRVPRPIELAQATHRVARCYVELGMPDTAAWYFQRALGWARTLASATTAVEILCELADALTRQADLTEEPAERRQCLERARDHAFEAASMAARGTDRRGEAAILLAISDVLANCGDHGDAVTLRDRARTLLSADTASA